MFSSLYVPHDTSYHSIDLENCLEMNYVDNTFALYRYRWFIYMLMAFSVINGTFMCLYDYGVRSIMVGINIGLILSILPCLNVFLKTLCLFVVSCLVSAVLFTAIEYRQNLI